MEARVPPVAMQHQLLQLHSGGELGGPLSPALRGTRCTCSSSSSGSGPQGYREACLWCDCTRSRLLWGKGLERIVSLGPPPPLSRQASLLTPWDKADFMPRIASTGNKDFFTHAAAGVAGAAAHGRELLLLLGSGNFLQQLQHAQASATGQLQRKQQKGEQAFILHLEPAAASPLQRCLSRLRAEAAEAFGVDDSHCYSLHCSVTGFFPFSDIIAFKQSIVKLAAELQQQQQQQQQQQEQQVGGGPLKVIATEDGYVVLPVQCPELLPLVQQLQQQQQQLKVKRVDHVTLAAFHQDPTRRRIIADFYNNHFARLGAESLVGPWDLVLYELRRQSAGFLVDGIHELRQLHRCFCSHAPTLALMRMVLSDFRTRVDESPEGSDDLAQRAQRLWLFVFEEPLPCPCLRRQ
ncbi:hypothetical protein ACSSS7_003480 [Eimeria intestinalis]